VLPTFTDIHTHLDAQLAWDHIGTSSCWHGITSVVLGNCGVTFAPVNAGDREMLAVLGGHLAGQLGQLDPVDARREMGEDDLLLGGDPLDHLPHPGFFV